MVIEQIKKINRNVSSLFDVVDQNTFSKIGSIDFRVKKHIFSYNNWERFINMRGELVEVRGNLARIEHESGVKYYSSFTFSKFIPSSGKKWYRVLLDKPNWKLY